MCRGLVATSGVSGVNPDLRGVRTGRGGREGSQKRASSGRPRDPFARRREPQGKGFSACAVRPQSGRGCLGGRGNAPAGGRQARPDLSTDKSGWVRIGPRRVESHTTAR